MSAHIFILDDIKSISTVFSYEFEYGCKIDNKIYKISVEDAHFSLARNFDDAIDIIRRSGKFDLWSLDFDLGNGDTGLEVLKAAAEICPSKWPDLVLVHSEHSGHRKEMQDFIAAFEKKRAKK